ncbi:MAG: hypothetical protein R6U58_13505 [Bacteroidales bacterium]
MQLYKKILIVSIILASVGLYQLRGLGIMVRLLDILTVVLIVGNLALFLIYGHSGQPVKKHFSVAVILLLSGVMISSLGAVYFNNQSWGITLYQQRHMYAFLFYFLLFYLAPRPQWIIDLLFYFGIAGGVIFIVQYLLYPTLITDAKIFLDRGTIRMNLPGTYFMHIGFFLSVDRFFTTKKMKYGAGAMLLFLVAVLSGFRSILALYILLSTGYLLANRQVKNKVLLFSLYSVIVISGFFAFHSIIMEMKESAEREGSQGTSYIRVRAADYFMSMNDNKKSAYIIGNGEPTERSAYGRRLAMISLRYGYYLSDIGIVGLFFKYGLLTSLMVLYIIFKVLFAKTDKRTVFIKLFFLFQLLLIFNSITSFEILSGIVAISMMLYLVDTGTGIRRSDNLSIPA